MLNAGMSDDRKQTALHLAVENSGVEEVETLVDNEANVNLKDENSETPSHYAAQREHSETVEKGKAEIDVLDGTKNSALHEAVRFGQLSTVKYLVKCGADVNSKDHASVSVLSRAVAAGCLMMAHFLVEKGAEINVVDDNGLTPLRHAANSGQWEVVKYLVERGAELSEESGALKRAVEGGQWRLATLLIENGASTKDLTEVEISEVLRNNSISLDGEAEDVISGLMVLGDAQLLENYINNNSEKNLEQVLPKVYQEIQLLNVHLSPSASLFVESHIIKSRLFSNKNYSDKSGIETVVESNNAAKRINLVIDGIENLERISSSLRGNEMSDGFLFVAKFIARNMEILKNELRFSAIKLPWTEMQFCLINFISGLCGSRPKKLDFISTLIQNKTRLMEHLSHFKTHLQSLTIDLKFDRKLKFDKRKDFIASVLRSSPGFQSLFEDYEVLRDVYSLNRIASYLHVASALDLEKEEEEDGLVSEQVILRALQVTGECLKNTEESPNMSDNVHRLLMAMAPTNIKEIVTSLRDSLSHVDHLHKVKHAENQMSLDVRKDQKLLSYVAKDRKWLLDIQKDVMKLEHEITVQLLSKKDVAVKTFCRRIFDCGCIESAKEIVRGVRTMDAVKMELNENDHFVIPKLMELMEKFKGLVEMPTEYQRGYFIYLEFVMEELEGRWKKVNKKQKENVNYVEALISLINDVDEDDGGGEMELIRRKAGSQMSKAKLETGIESNYYSQMSFSIAAIYNSWEESDRLLHSQLYCEIVKLIDFEATRAQSIDKLSAEMEKKLIYDDENEKIKKNEEKVNEILREIFIENNNLIRNEFLVQIDNKKELYRLKKQLMEYYSQIARMYGAIYDNCVDIFNGLITSFQLLCDCFSSEKADSKKNQSIIIIKLIAENELDQLLSELNLKTLVKKEEFKNVLEKIRSRKLTKIEDIFLSKGNNSPIDELLIDKVNLKYNEKNIGINLKKVFDILIKNSKKKVDLLEKEGKNRKKDEIKVAEVIELGQSIEQIKVDLSMDDKSFNVPALTKALNLSDQTLVLDDVSLANCKYMKQNLSKFDTYGKLVKEASNEAEMSKLNQPFKKFIQSLNSKFNQPEVADLAVEKAFQKLENQQKIRLKKFFIQKLDILTAIFPLEKTDLELLNLLKSDNNIRLAVEILLLNLTETLENLSLFHSNRLFLDKICPVLVGKNLRNYLAHGDPLINIILSADSFEISLINHFRLFQQRQFSLTSDLCFDQLLIGKPTREDLDTIADNYNHSRSILLKKDEMCRFKKTTNVEDFKKLIDKPIYVNVRDSFGHTLLHFSAFANNLSVFQYLFEHGLSPFIGNAMDHSPIQMAVALGIEKIIQYLLKIGFDPSFIVENGDTLLHMAVHFGHLDIVRLLLRYKADMQALNNEENTPIAVAVTYARQTIFVELLEAGSDVESRDKNGKTLAHLANAEILKVLLEKNVDLNALDRDLNTPLHSACYRGDEEVVAMLLDKRVDVICRSKDGVSPIHMAASEGQLKIVQLLLAKNTELVDIQMFKKATPLYFACLYGHLEMVKLLIDNGADVNTRYKEDNTALHVATMMGHLRVMDFLLDLSTLAIDSFSRCGRTALHFAAQFGSVDAFKKLVARGANISLPREGGGLTTLHLASHAENLELMKFILEMNKELIESVDSRGQTALHLCAIWGRINSLKLLINSGANLEAKDCDGSTPLLISAFKGHADVFLALSRNGASLEARKTDNWSAVHFAAQNNNITIMQNLIERKMNLNEGVNVGHTALHFAAENRHLEMVKLLVENGANVDLWGWQCWTALHCAAASGHESIVRYLVKKKACVNSLTEDKISPLHLICAHGNVSSLTILIDNGADFHAKSETKWTALHYAAERGGLDIVEALLNKVNAGVNQNLKDFINCEDDEGLTALHLSAHNGHFDVVRVLLKCGASVNIGCSHNNTALHSAIEGDHSSCVLLLIENGANVNAENDTKCTPLHFAAENGHFDIVQILLNVQSDAIANAVSARKVVQVDCKTDLGATPLHLSAIKGHVEVVKLLLEHNADINSRDNEKWTALHYASVNGHHQTVDLLMEKNALLLFERLGFSALHLAAKDGHKRVVEMIISRNMDTIDLPIEENLITPLHFAAGNNHTDVMEFLLDKGADINSKSDDNWTALHFAIVKGHSKIVEILLNRGAAVNNNDSSPPLHLAVKKNNLLITSILINNGAADVNAINQEGRTALHNASGIGNVDMVELLVNSGAETNSKASSGSTPLHMAAFNAHSTIVEFLLNNGARINERMEGGDTALHWAVKQAHLSVVDELLSFEADANATNELLETPLHIAVDLNLIEIAEVLIKVGRAGVLARDWHDTVLHKAVRHEKMLELILREIKMQTEVWLRRAAMNARDNEGDSPLMWAAEQGRLGEVKMLLACQEVDVDMRNDGGATAVHWAVLKGHAEVVEALVIEGKAKIDVRNGEGESALDLAMKHIVNDEKYESIAAFLLSFTN